jgi:hypothetical protein
MDTNTPEVCQQKETVCRDGFTTSGARAGGTTPRDRKYWKAFDDAMRRAQADGVRM